MSADEAEHGNAKNQCEVKGARGRFPQLHENGRHGEDREEENCYRHSGGSGEIDGPTHPFAAFGDDDAGVGFAIVDAVLVIARVTPQSIKFFSGHMPGGCVRRCWTASLERAFQLNVSSWQRNEQVRFGWPVQLKGQPNIGNRMANGR